MRNIDNMSREAIVAELTRIASYLNTTYNLNAHDAGKPAKAPQALVEKGMAIGRREMCASVADDIFITFGVGVADNENGGAQ